jgi:hypothetical protein
MAKWSVLAGLGLVVALGGCTSRSPLLAYTTPGWYLERPRLLLVSGPEIFAGPFTYVLCVVERLKFETATRLLCIMEKTRPGAYGPYSPAGPAPSLPPS